MTETLFGLGSTLAMIGWVALLTSPFVPRASQWISGVAIPLVLALAYTGIVLAFWGESEGGFESLEAVMVLFTQPEIALAGWLHFLAFDLFVGAWIVRTARAEGIGFGFVVPCLVPTFLFGPAGLLLFQTIRLARAGRRRTGSGAPSPAATSREGPQ